MAQWESRGSGSAVLQDGEAWIFHAGIHSEAWAGSTEAVCSHAGMQVFAMSAVSGRIRLRSSLVPISETQRHRFDQHSNERMCECFPVFGVVRSW